jgi:hypothetical protein
MFIRSATPLPTGTQVKLEVEVAQGGLLALGIGEVVWRREAANADEVGFGLKFEALLPQASQFIETLLKHGGIGATKLLSKAVVQKALELPPEVPTRPGVPPGVDEPTTDPNTPIA